MKTNLRPGQKKEKTEEDTPQLLGKLSDLPPEALSPFRQKRNRPPIKYRLGLFLESRDYQPINIPPLLTHMMTGSKASLKSHSTPITQRTLPWYASLLSKDFPTLKGSYISFYKNGKPQGVAFSDIAAPIPAAAAVPEQHRKPLESFLPDPPIADDGSIGYYPTVSLFSGGSVRLNFGPDFEFPPTDLGKKGKWRPMCERLADREAEVCLNAAIDDANWPSDWSFLCIVCRKHCAICWTRRRPPLCHCSMGDDQLEKTPHPPTWMMTETVPDGRRRGRPPRRRRSRWKSEGSRILV